MLYDTLSTVWTCREPKAHALNIALNLDNSEAGAIVQAENFHFSVAVTCPYFEDTCHLIVHTAHNDFCMYEKFKEDHSLKKKFLKNKVTRLAAGTDSSRLSRFNASPAAHRAGGQRTGSLKCAESKVHDLGLEEDLCCWLRNSSVIIETKKVKECRSLGSLETRGGPRSLFSYLHRDEYRKQGPYSLDDVLTRAHHERRAIPLEDRIRTASLLAVGVLHLNISSWLRQVWSSRDVHFFDTNGYERCTMGEPFLEGKLDTDTERGPVYRTKNPAATRSCLLSLGLVLIELAFIAPWRKLQLQENLAEDLFEWERDLLDVMRLSNTVSRELGSRYAKVVQTCLFLGLETQETQGLGEAELDQVILEDIVRELDRCLSAVTFKAGV